MRGIQTFIRTTELGLALVSTYLTVFTLLQTSLYAKFKPLLIYFLALARSIFGGLPLDLAYLDLAILALALMLSLLFWRRGDEAGFGRLFTLNMLMFFPAVIDFSMFNWVNLILPYDPSPLFTPLWVLAVGLLLQATYIALRYTIRVRGLRDDLLGRGAEVEDVDKVSKGQISYLGLLVAVTAAITAAIYYATPLMKGLLRFEAARLPYPHVIIGIACTLLIAAAIVIYLRGAGPKPTTGPKERTQNSEPGLPSTQVT